MDPLFDGVGGFTLLAIIGYLIADRVGHWDGVTLPSYCSACEGMGILIVMPHSSWMPAETSAYSENAEGSPLCW